MLEVENLILEICPELEKVSVDPFSLILLDIFLQGLVGGLELVLDSIGHALKVGFNLWEVMGAELVSVPIE